jgi:transposase
MKDLARFLEMSVLSLRHPGLRVGYDAMRGLYEGLGRRQGPVLAFERALAEASSKLVAVDGHVVGSGSLCNDLAGKGYRFGATHCDQMNLLMAYDALGGEPLACRIVEGGLLDKASLADLVADVPLDGVLWLVDSGFHSAANVELLSSGGNDYIMPLHKGLRACKDAVAEMELRDRFAWARGRKATVVEWKEHDAGRGQRVLVLRDCNQAAIERSNYLRYLAQGRKGYTEGGFAAAEPFFGVIVLQTSLADATAEQVWDHYKRRWTIETYYDWLKNGMGLQGLYQRDYCRAQGLAFVCLVASLVRKALSDLVKSELPGRTVDEVLLDARLVKAHLRHGSWGCCNCKGSVRELFSKLGVPLEVKFPLPAPAHT